MTEETTRNVPSRLRELALLFLRLGTIGFGGPLAHMAMMQDEVVDKRRWMSRQQFLDLVGATNLIPGPSSTELAIHIGQKRAGWPGLIVAGTCFILPAFCIVLFLAWIYARYGNLPQTRWLLYGVQPVVVAIIAQAVWKFAAAAFKGAFSMAVFMASLLLLLLWKNELAVIALAALVGLATGWRQRGRTEEPDLREVLKGDKKSDGSTPALLIVGTSGLMSPVLAQLFWVFLKLGAVIYGSGYVLLAWLRADLVERLGWLTDQQLLDAIAIGQVTPGPVFTTATFIGYQVAVAHQLPGWSGAVVATVAIFLPSFAFVGLLSLVLERHRKSPILRRFLDAVNAASLALMAVVLAQLTRGALVDVTTFIIALVALGVLLVTKFNSAWLIAAGAIMGYTLHNGR